MLAEERRLVVAAGGLCSLASGVGKMEQERRAGLIYVTLAYGL